MTTVIHTPECLAQQARTAELVAEATLLRSDWLNRFPGFCRACEGAGGFRIPQTYWEPSDWSPCACVENGQCPRCGKSFDTENDYPCPHCGWNWGRGPEDTAPFFDGYDGECPCERKAHEEYMRSYWESEPSCEYGCDDYEATGEGYDPVTRSTKADRDAAEAWASSAGELTECECDSTHEANDTVCRWCWAHGRRHWNDPETKEINA